MKKKLIYSVIITCLFAFGNLAGQDNPSDLYLNPATDDFATIQQNMEHYFAGKDLGRGSGYKQWKRWEYFNERRLTPDGKITNVDARNWEAYHTYMENYTQNNGDNLDVTNGYWAPLGITSYTNGAGWNPGIGRVNVVVFHPTLSNTIWIGCPSGGLWKTTTGGTSWTPLTDGMPRIGVSGIAVDYTNTNVMYILTGDGDGGDTKSIGVLKTINGGTTWLSTGLLWDAITDGVRGYKLAMHPTNNNILFCVSTAGIHKTINGGATWTLELAGSYRDLEFKPNDPTYIYVSGANSFYRSTNTGDSFAQITSGVPTGCQRIALAVTPNNTAYVYLFAGPPTGKGSFKGVYLSANSGGSFSVRSTTPNILGYSSIGNDNKHQTAYDLAMAVSRTNSAYVICGGINTWRSTNSGTSWGITSMWDDYNGVIGYTHADIHDLAINPLNNYLYCASDGGLYRSTDFGLNWTNLSVGLEITQWYRIAGYEPSPGLIIGGTQDNGSNKWTGGSSMQHILGADGMDCMIDHSNSNIMYYCTQNGGLEKSTNGGATHDSIQPPGSVGEWVTPYVMNPTNASIIYGGYNDVYKSTNGGIAWTNKGVDGRGAMAIGGPSNPYRVYASYGTSIWMSDNAADSWTSISTGLPGITITFIAVNPGNSADVFVTLGGYTAGQKVYRSTNAGSSWTNISGSLPNVTANCIAYEATGGSPDDALYIGTDIGVFYRNNTIGDWIPFMNGLPTVPVFDLEINETYDVIRAGTYGRGIWSSPLYTGCPAAYTLYPGNDPGNPNYTGFQYYEASSTVVSSRIITGGTGTDVTYKAGSSITLTDGFHARENNLFQAVLGPCTATSPPAFKPVTGKFAGKMSDR